jgi:hypothetical protein
MLHKEYVLVGEFGLRIRTASIRTTGRSDTGEKLPLILQCAQIVWYDELSLSNFQDRDIEHAGCTLGDI